MTHTTAITGSAATDVLHVRAKRRRGGALRVLAGVLLATTAAATAGGLAWAAMRGMPEAPRWAIAAGGVLAFAGAGALFGWAAGLLHFGQENRHRTFLDAFTEALKEACLVTDRRGRPVYANSAYRELIAKAGRSRLVGLDNLYAGFPEPAQQIYRLSLKARDGESGEAEFRLEAGQNAPGAREGSHAWIRIRTSPMRLEGQELTLWRVSDVTDERARQDRAFVNLQHIIDYLDNMPAGLFSTLPDGRITYLNATLGEWLGLDLERMMSQSLTLTDVLPEEIATQLAAIAPEPGVRRVETFHADLRSASGETIPVRIIHRVDHDAAGRPRPSRTLVLDMRGTRLDAERQAHKLARFVNSAPVGIAMADADGRLTMLNAALAQITSEAHLGDSIAQIVAPADRDRLMRLFRSVASGERLQAQGDFNIESGSETRAQITIAATETDQDGVRALTLYVIDTTLQQGLMQQLEQGQKMQAVGKLVSGIAHDFNNMLTAILGFSDMLLQKHRPEDPSFEQIMNIKQNANRAAAMVRQLLAFSRKQTLQPRVISLTDLLSDMIAMLRRSMGEKIELTLEHGRDLWPVFADPSQIDRVIMNLAVNARDAMPRGGKLTVRTANVPAEEAARIAPDIMPDMDYVLIEVTDTGEGIPPELLDKIYDPFFTTKAVGKGTGLGLSTVYGIVKQTGGYIFCDSKPGEGTTFRIYLPRHVETESERAKRLEARQAESEGREDLTGSGRILLVEDEDAVRAFAVHALKARGYDVIEASSGEIALDTMEEMLENGENVDLIVSDVVMPGMDGPTMLGELRKMGVSAPVVFMSGHAEDAFAESLEEDVEFTFLAKPFNLKQIAETVKRAMP